MSPLEIFALVASIPDLLSLFTMIFIWLRVTKPKSDPINYTTINGNIVVTDSIAEGPPEKSLNQFEERVLQMFEVHKISLFQIPLFITKCVDSSFLIKPYEMASVSSIINSIGTENIYKSADLFEVNNEWLHGGDRIYKYRNFYKDISSLIKFIFDLQLKGRRNKVTGYALRSSEGFDKGSQKHQHLYIILMQEVASFNGNSIQKFIPIQTDWNWGYWRTRFEAKAIFYLEDHKSDFINLTGLEIEGDALTEFNFTSQFPDQLLKGNKHWSPYDYSTSSEENVHAKETDEFPLFFDYLKEMNTFEAFENAKKEYLRKLLSA